MYDTRNDYLRKGFLVSLLKNMTKEEYAACTRCCNTMLDLIKKYGAEVKDAETQTTRK